MIYFILTPWSTLRAHYAHDLTKCDHRVGGVVKRKNERKASTNWSAKFLFTESRAHGTADKTRDVHGVNFFEMDKGRNGLVAASVRDLSYISLTR